MSNTNGRSLRVMRNRLLLAFLMVLTAGHVDAPAAAAQTAKNAAIGGGLGFLGGVVSTVSIVVARARFQNLYLDSAADLIHWQTTPLIVGPTAGVAFGLLGDEVLRGSITGSASGLLIGSVAGAALGWAISTEQEAPWAGGVIGAGVGLNIGGVLGAYLQWREEDDEHRNDEPLVLTVRVPL